MVKGMRFEVNFRIRQYKCSVLHELFFFKENLVGVCFSAISVFLAVIAVFLLTR